MRVAIILLASWLGWVPAASGQDVTSSLETVASAPASSCGSAPTVVAAPGLRARAVIDRGRGPEIVAMTSGAGAPTVEARLGANAHTFFKLLAGTPVVGTRRPGGIHRLEGTSWSSVSGLPPSASVADLLGLGRKRYALLQTSAGGMVARAHTGRSGWEIVLRLTDEQPLSLLPLAREAYVFTSRGRVYVEEAEGFSASKASLFPRVKKGSGVLIAHRPVEHGGETLYLGARVGADGSQRPAGLFAGSSPHNVRRIILHGMTVRDILSTGKRFYALATSAKGPRRPTRSTKVERYGPDSAPLSGPPDGGRRGPTAEPAPVPGRGLTTDGGTAALAAPVARPSPPVWNWVVASTNLMVWEDILAFRSTRPASSFAQVGGDFYVAVECDPARPLNAPARVVRIEARHWKQWRRAWIY